jgi:hypothetical protein
MSDPSPLNRSFVRKESDRSGTEEEQCSESGKYTVDLSFDFSR